MSKKLVTPDTPSGYDLAYVSKKIRIQRRQFQGVPAEKEK